MKKNWVVYLIVFVFIILIPSFNAFSNNASFKKIPEAKKGILDLRDWSFEKGGAVDLSGEWEFYWKTQLNPDYFPKESQPENLVFIKVPSIWNDYKINNKKPYGNGYATYRLTVFLPDLNDAMSMWIKEVGTSYTLYVNGKKICSAGIAGKSIDSTTPRALSQIADFLPEGNRLNILLHISNFHHQKGGIRGHIRLGTEKNIREIYIKSFVFQLFLLGSILIMGLYHICLYLLRRKDYSPLYFGIICLLISLRILVTNEKYITTLIPSISWEFIVRIDYFTVNIAPAVLLMFVAKLFPQEFSKNFLRMIQCIVIIIYSIVLFTPPIIFSYTPAISHIVVLSSLFYVIYVVILSAIHQRDGAFVFLLGFLVVFIAIINDILFEHGILHTLYLTPLGLFLFIFSQAYLLSLRFSKAFFSVEKLSNEIEENSIELERKNVQLTKLDKLKDEFLSNTSHELRTPLNGIIGLAESLINGARGTLSQGIKSDLAMIASSGKRLTNLVNDILDFSKLKNKDINLQQKPIDIGQLVDIVIALSMSMSLLKGKKLKIINKIHQNIPLVYADENRLQQILYNLIGNAIKFTEEGAISIEASAEDNMVEISVSDTGIGIPEDKQELIFQSFEQVDGSIERIYGGTGLGLSIAKSIIELHRGKIWVESKINCGSTFYFTMPIAKHELVIEAYKKAVNKREDNTCVKYEEDILNLPDKNIVNRDIKKIKILAVDDEQVNLQVIQNNLSIEGIYVETAYSGIEALDKLKTNFFNLILLDVMMPKMNGYETAIRIRETIPKEELPIIFLTAKNQSNDLAEGFSSGGNDYITKPFSGKELITRLTFHIELAKSRQNLKLTNMHINHLLEATKDMMKTDKKVMACVTALKHLLALEEKKEIKQADLYLPQKSSNSYSRYTLWQNGNLIENPTPSDVLKDKADLLKSAVKILLTTDGTLIVPIGTEKKPLAYLLIEGSLGLFESAQNIIEGIGHSLALKIENIDSEENSRLSSIGIMAASIVHDLKNPIGAIIGYADMAGDDNISSEMRKEYLEIISNEATRMSNMAHEVLEFSRGEINLNFEEINSKDYIEDLVKIISPILMNDNVAFDYQFNYDGLFYFDLDRIRRVILNLVTNAKDALAGAKTKDAKFTLKFEKKKGGVQISAADNGPGIPEHIQTTIYEPFVTFGKSHGTGLGMATVKKIIEAHNGNISFETKKNEGTIFTIFLPITEVVLEKKSKTQKNIGETTKYVSGKKILIVDDNPIHRQMYSKYLNSWNCNFDEATNAEQALEKLRYAFSTGAHFDLAIIDKQLPGLNGEELGKIIKEDLNLKDIILIMITGAAKYGDAFLVKDIGFSAYLTKPVKNIELLECLNSVLNIKDNTLITRYKLPSKKKSSFLILIAEDNIVNQKLILRFLNKADYNADIVANGKEAIKALEMNNYDLVLMDIEMPVMDGFKAAELIRSLEKSQVINHNIPIIAMTGHSGKEDINKCFEAGMNDYIPKPIKQEKLVEVINKYFKF